MGKAIKPPMKQAIIRKTSGVVGGEARIRETRIPVWNLVQLQRMGMKERAIRTYFVQSLTAADLSAAWEYYEKHPAEIDRAVRENEAE